MLLQLRMRTLRVAFKCGEPSNSGVQHVEVLRYRQIMHIVESLNTFNFDLAQTLIHRVHARVVGGCVVVSGAGGRIDLHRGQAMAKRVHSRARFAFLSAGAVAFGAVALVCCDLPLRCHGPYFPDADITPASWAPIALSVATRSTRALASERFSRSFKYWSRRFCAATIRPSIFAKAGSASWKASISKAFGGYPAFSITSMISGRQSGSANHCAAS